MLIPRNTYLHIAGVELGAFKPLQMRDQVPGFAAENVDRDSRGYLGIEAVMLAIGEMVQAHTGLDRNGTKRLVENHADEILRVVLGKTAPDFILVIDGEHPELYFGTEGDLRAKASEILAEWSDIFHAFTIIPARTTIDGVLQRADDAGVKIDLAHKQKG